MEQTFKTQSAFPRRKVLSGIGKTLLAGLIAFLALEACCSVYFNKPIHNATPGGPTDYVWEKNVFYSNWTEGIGYGRTNNEGYYNLGDYDPDAPLDILIMGSSFMQAEQVPQNESAAAVLPEYLPGYRVYNIGTAAHRLPQSLQNLQCACEVYRPRYVVLETQNLGFSSEDLQLILAGDYPEEVSNDSPLLLLLKRSNFLNLLYYQLSYYRDEHGGIVRLPELQPLLHRADAAAPSAEDDTLSRSAAWEGTESTVPEGPESTASEGTGSNVAEGLESAAPEAGTMQMQQMAEDENRSLMRQVLTKARDEAAAAGATVVIVYHPKTWMDGYGGMLVYDESESSGFEALCDECGIVFLNMSETYRAEYRDHYALPYGFANTAIGVGHLNRDGHRMIARELASVIAGLDA